MNFTKILILFIIAFGINSCKNDLEINAPYEDIAVVYGFIDQNQPIQYIRIQKLYQNNATMSTNEGAQFSDSLYFDSLVVNLIQGSNTYPCNKIDTIYKDSGFFGNQKHFLYACAIPKNNSIDESYQLLIYHPKSGKTFKSSTSIVKDAVIEARTIPIRTTPDGHSFPFRFMSGKNSFLYDLVIRFNYKEMNKTDTTISSNKYYDYYVRRSGEYTYKEGVVNSEIITSQNFLTSLKDGILRDNNKVRKAIGIEFIAFGGSKEYKDLLDLSKPNTSIVQKNTEYSNIENGKGIFSSRNYSIQSNMKLDASSINSIVETVPNFNK